MRPVWALLLALLAGASSAAELTLGVHTEDPAHRVASLLAESAPKGTQITIKAFGSAAEIERQLRSGELDLAVIEEPTENWPAVAVISDLYPSVLHLLYKPATEPISVYQMLAESKIWAGATGGIGESLIRKLLRDSGMSDAEPHLLDNPWTEEPEVFFLFGGILAHDALSRLSGYKLYSLGDPGQLGAGSVAEAISLRSPNLRPFIIPAELYPKLSRDPVLSLSVSTLLLAKESLDEQVAYQLAMTVEQIRSRISAYYPLAGLQAVGETERGARALALHSGAARFRDRDQPGLLERYAEVFGMAATLAFALISGTVAWRRHRRQSRKDRLDKHYAAVMDQRPHLAGDTAEKEEALAEIRAIQTTVMQLVIEERIDADGALLAFLSLSNQLLQEGALSRSSGTS
ncbi:MAG: hypothetical protein V7696_01585 [Halioglobus sp.]